MDHIINITPWRSTRSALAAHFDWSCSCGRRASRPSADRAAAEADSIRHTPPTANVSRHFH